MDKCLANWKILSRCQSEKAACGKVPKAHGVNGATLITGVHFHRLSGARTLSGIVIQIPPEKLEQQFTILHSAKTVFIDIDGYERI